MIADVLGGSFDGPWLSGTVTGGSDWAVKRVDGLLEVDVRAQLRTTDGTPILLSYTGLSERTPEHGVRILSNVRLEAPVDSPHAFVNGLVCAAAGWADAGGVTYAVHALRHAD